MVKAEETSTLTEVKDEAVKQVTMLQNHLSNEWVEVKEYQKASWQAGKEQNAKNWSKIKALFTKVKDNATQD